MKLLQDHYSSRVIPNRLKSEMSTEKKRKRENNDCMSQRASSFSYQYQYGVFIIASLLLVQCPVLFLMQTLLKSLYLSLPFCK